MNPINLQITNNNQEYSLFEFLPNEIICQIFSYFIKRQKDEVNILTTCKKFHDIGVKVFDWAKRRIKVMSEKGTLEEVQKELKDYPSLSSACLANACRHNRLQIVHFLMQQDQIISSLNSTQKRLPLFEACTEGHIEIVKLLLQEPRLYNAHTLAQNVRLARANGHLDLVDFLKGFIEGQPQ